MIPKLDPSGVIISCPNCDKKNRLVFERLGEPMRCGQCKQEVRAPGNPIEIPTAADFDRLIAHASLPVVVDYWAPWCGPCRMVAPEIEKVASRQAGRFLVVKVDTEALQDLGARFGIRSIPTLAVFMNGKEIARTAGARPAADIEAFVSQAVQTVGAQRNA